MSERIVHELKTWPDVFAAIVNGEKTAEFRKDDRGFEVGHGLLLREWSPDHEEYSGESYEVDVTHVVRGGQFGIPEGYAMLSFKAFQPVPLQGEWREKVLERRAAAVSLMQIVWPEQQTLLEGQIQALDWVLNEILPPPSTLRTESTGEPVPTSSEPKEDTHA